MAIVNREKHFGQIDTLRAFSIIMVILTHWLPNTGFGYVPPLTHGVDMFFTISGFLITYLFFIDKEKYADTKGKVVVNFYIRRLLRIFPIYYLFLFFFIFLNKTLHLWIWNEGNGIYYLSYTSNILFFLKGDQSTELQHTWSLCVEEQFYIIWPLFLILIPKRQTLYFLVFVYLVGIVSNIFWTNNNIRALPLGNFHTLGIGALLAYIVFYHKSGSLYIEFLQRYSFLAFIVAFTALCVVLYAHFSNNFMKPLLISLSSFFILFTAYNGNTKLLGPVLNSKPLQYIGKLSYGIYLYHKPLPSFIKIACLQLHLELPPPFLYFTLCLAILIPVVLVSYYFIEKPILKLKTKFV